MTTMNKRRKNKKPVNLRYGEGNYHNGYSATDNKRGVIRRQEIEAEYAGTGVTVLTGVTGSGGDIRIGKTDYLDKSMHSWGRKSSLADRTIGASIGNDFTNGHRGMAKAVRGAKKFVRSRIRFHENNAVKKMLLVE